MKSDRFPTKRRTKKLLLIIACLALIVPGLLCCCNSALEYMYRDSEPSLQVANTDADGEVVFTSVNNLSNNRAKRTHIVVVTHGWFEELNWPADTAAAIYKKTDSKKWLCGWLNWRGKAAQLNPTDAARYGRDQCGAKLARAILHYNNKPEHIHLIGHSAGCWAVAQAAAILGEKTDASIHLTYLDAYVPLFWKAQRLTDMTDGGKRYFAEHYFTRDITLATTEVVLPGVCNVDITDADPDLPDHKFAWNWYLATVMSDYDPQGKYAGKALNRTADGLELGYAMSLEAGGSDWPDRRLAASKKVLKLPSAR